MKMFNYISENEPMNNSPNINFNNDQKMSTAKNFNLPNNNNGLNVNNNHSNIEVVEPNEDQLKMADKIEDYLKSSLSK